ncbi:translational GTPase TypA, partial [Francisella tularensis subsp. holarctica]|nr:translational GTPase TypA [Francisella tularensis subsp. holarctica]
GARPGWVVDQVYDLFDILGATDEQLDFPVIYASAIDGWANNDINQKKDDMTDLFKAIVENVEHPNFDENCPFQMQISSLDYSN